MKIAIAQFNPIIGDFSGNAQQILEAARQATDAGARLLLTSELSLCGYPPRDLLLNPGFIQSASAQLQHLAHQLPQHLAVLVGTVEENPQAALKGEKPIFNSIAYLEGGTVQQTYHKRLLPSYDVFDEDRYFEPGRQSEYFVLKTLGAGETVRNSASHAECKTHRKGSRGAGEQGSKGAGEQGSKGAQKNSNAQIKVGFTICEDLWNDEEFWGKRNYEINPIEDLSRLGVDLVVNLSASPYSVGKQKVRESMLQHLASRHRLPIIYANQVGANDDLIFDGCSVALNRAGEVVCRAKAFEPDLIFLEFAEESNDLLTASITPPPESDEEEIWSALVLGVKDYAHKCGFSKVVLGLSGGIDSSLVAAIAAEAMGPQNVLGVMMPSPYSSEHSLNDAQALIDNLGINSQKLPIQKTMEAYDGVLEPLFQETESGIAEENIQSRIRGNLLMAISNKFGYLLVSTGNKSEMAVGYCTLYGDMSGGLAAIADVPKTRVYSLCRWLNRNGEVIPANVLSKPPSAELKPGQVDRDSLPSYEILDDILDRAIEEHQSAAQIMEAGHDREVVDKVMKLLIRAEFKRRQAPPALKVTDRAFGTGWRMPIASRWFV